jgi:hypothetical protein
VPFIVDDRFHSHAKTLKTSMGARGLWVSAGSWSADQGTDGRVPLHVLLALGGTPEQIDELTAPGSFWEGGPEAVEFHDWEYWNTLPGIPEAPSAVLTAVPEAGPAPRTAGARKAALRRAPGLKQKVRARDGDLCRYCGTAVLWGMGRAPDSGMWDWVEPGGPASPENVVTACKACGGEKAGRSLKDAGMALLPPPVPHRRTPSEQEKQPRTPSCIPSKGDEKGVGIIDRSNRDQNPSSGVNQSNAGARGTTAPETLAFAVARISRKLKRPVTEAGALQAIAAWNERAEKAGHVIDDPVKFYGTCISRARDLEELVAAPLSEAAQKWAELGAEPVPLPGTHAFVPSGSEYDDSCAYPGCGVKKKNARHQTEGVKAG